MTQRRRLLAGTAAAAVSIALIVAGCGGGDDDQRASTDRGSVEQAFLQSMVPHHSSAIEMTEIADERAEAPEIQALAEEIASTQETEIETMESIHERLFDSELEPDHTAHEGLGLSAEEAGMDHLDAAAALEDAEPFDRAFVDEMVPHHEGAIVMAETVLEQTDDAELTELAEGIVATQKEEIAEMNEFRQEEYGAPVPESGAGDGEHEQPGAAPDAQGHGAGHSG